MRVGTICYACDSGLGILAKSFVDSGVVTNILVVKHSKHPTHADWHPNAPTTKIRPFDTKLAQDFCASMDVMLFFETPFSWPLVEFCREHGVKTILMPMHECTPSAIPRLDLFLCPSELEFKVFGDGETPAAFVPVPVEGVRWRKRERALTFVHNAGHGGLRGRNGTSDVFEAMRYVRSPIKLIVRTQDPLDFSSARAVSSDRRVEVRVGTVPASELWDEGDVFLFPERFNGLSLPIQEARAAGMVVMCGNRFPMRCWLPNEPLIPVKDYRKARIGPPYVEFDEATFDPLTIAVMIDSWFDRDVSDLSLGGLAYAEQNSWAVLKPRYDKLLKELAG